MQPIFNAGRNRSQVALAEARREESELVYRQTIQQAFREVSDALVGYRRLREFREAQQQVVVAASDARRLADLRYRGGATSYLEVLDSDTRLFIAELGLARRSWRSERLRRDLSRARRRLAILSNGDLMSHRNVEILIGRLLTDEDLRRRFTREPAATLDRVFRAGMGTESWRNGGAAVARRLHVG